MDRRRVGRFPGLDILPEPRQQATSGGDAPRIAPTDARGAPPASAGSRSAPQSGPTPIGGGAIATMREKIAR